MKVIVHNKLIDLQYVYAISPLDITHDYYLRGNKWFSTTAEFNVSFLNERTLEFEETIHSSNQGLGISEEDLDSWKEAFIKHHKEAYDELISLWTRTDKLNIPEIKLFEK